jgi:polyisoprenoid-binding protein YceI
MAKPSRRPSKRFAMLAAAGALTMIVVAFLLVYFVVFPTSSPKPFKLSSSENSTGTVTASNATHSAASAAQPGASSGSTTARAGSSSGVGEKWTIATGSQAGYRVREKLAFLPAESDAVGRTSQITGSATFNQSKAAVTITAASFNVAVDTLKSDRSMRDEKIHEIGLESSRYPTATFALSKSVVIPAAAVKGRVVTVSVTGTFDIHGVAKVETLPVEMRISGTTFQAVGSLTFPWSEFGMTAPSIGGFVNVTEKATMEFDLRMRRA